MASTNKELEFGVEELYYRVDVDRGLGFIEGQVQKYTTGTNPQTILYHALTPKDVQRVRFVRIEGRASLQAASVKGRQ